MAFLTNRRRGALALASLAALVSLAACGEDDKVITLPSGLEDDLFLRYVALGNSITAGYQSGGLNDSLQNRSYAALLAKDIFHTGYQVNLLRKPGCPAPITTFGGGRLGGTTAPPCSLITTTTPRYVNNVAVPGALVIDATNNNTSSSNTLTVLLSGGLSQVTRARAADPTFVSVWLGNNDVLLASTVGLPSATASVPGVPGVASPGVTAVNTFNQRYALMIDSLRQGKSLQGGVLLGVVDVTNIPYFITGASLDNPTNRALFNAAAGRAVTILPNCTGNTNALIGIGILSLLRANAALPVSCTKVPNTSGGAGNDPVVGELFILDQAERASVQAAVTGYNTYIKAKADSLGWAYVDPNELLIAERTAGRITTFPNFAAPAGGNFFGADISFDAVHPSSRAHRASANAVARAVSTKYTVPLDTIAIP
jgi:lysophospholipase L1-like esterase